VLKQVSLAELVTNGNALEKSLLPYPGLGQVHRVIPIKSGPAINAAKPSSKNPDRTRHDQPKQNLEQL